MSLPRAVRRTALLVVALCLVTATPIATVLGAPIETPDGGPTGGPVEGHKSVAESSRLAGNGGGRAAGSGPTGTNPGGSGPPEGEPSPFSISFDGAPTISVGNRSTVFLTVTARRPVTSVEVSVVEPFGFDVSANRTALGNLATNESAVVALAVTPTRPVARDLTVELSAGDGDGDYEVADRASVELDATPPTGGSSATGGGGPLSRPPAVGDGTDTGSDSGGTVGVTSLEGMTVAGRAEYTNDGETHPLARTEVTIYDYDATDPPVELAETRTNASGGFAVTLNATGDADGDGNASVVVVIHARNPAAYVVNDAGVTYAYRSERTTLTAGTHLTVGTDVDGDAEPELVPASSNPAYQALAWTREAARYVETHTADGWSREPLRVEYPVGTWPYFQFVGSDDRVVLPDRTYFSWEASTVYHEYGHAVVFSVYGPSDYPDGDGYAACHTFTSETDPVFAVEEGWAEFFAAAVAGEPTANRYGTMEDNRWYDVDTDGRCVPGDADGTMDGYRVEGSVASILWDVVDDPPTDDDDLSQPFGAVFATLQRAEPSTITGFYDAWAATPRGRLDATYTRYGVDKRAPRLTPDITNGSTVYNESVRLAGSVTDESAVSRLEIRVDGGEWVSVDPSGGDWAHRVPLSLGNHTLEVRAVDAFGNERTVTRRFRRAEVPYAVSVAVADGTRRVAAGDSVPVRVTYRAPAATNLTLTLQAGSTVVGRTTSPLRAATYDRVTVPVVVDADADEGSYDVSASLAGNASNESSEAVVVDNTPPALSVDAPSTVTDPEAAVDVSVADGSNVTLSLLVRSTGFARVRTVRNGTYTLTAGVMAGENSVVVVATDAAGNENRTTLLITHDGVAAEDIDGDGRHEDLNRNGRLDIGDVQALFFRRAAPGTTTYADAFDFNGNGGFDIGDVQALFREYLSS